MSKYFLIEARSPFDSAEVNNNYQLARDLAQSGHETTLFLIENGVFAARQAAQGTFGDLSAVKVVADEFSLRERGIGPDEVSPAIALGGVGDLVDAMAEGQKTMWL